MDQTPPSHNSDSSKSESHNSDSPNPESKGARTENQPEWFAKVNNENGVTVGESGDSKNNRRRIVPLVAALAIVSAAAAYGLNKNSDGAHSVKDSTTQSSLPAPTITGGPDSQNGFAGPNFHHPGEGIDPDGDNWSGANRHRPPHGFDDGDHHGFEDDDNH